MRRSSCRAQREIFAICASCVASRAFTGSLGTSPTKIRSLHPRAPTETAPTGSTPACANDAPLSWWMGSRPLVPHARPTSCALLLGRIFLSSSGLCACASSQQHVAGCPRALRVIGSCAWCRSSVRPRQSSLAILGDEPWPKRRSTALLAKSCGTKKIRWLLKSSPLKIIKIIGTVAVPTLTST